MILIPDLSWKKINENNSHTKASWKDSTKTNPLIPSQEIYSIRPLMPEFLHLKQQPVICLTHPTWVYIVYIYIYIEHTGWPTKKTQEKWILCKIIPFIHGVCLKFWNPLNYLNLIGSQTCFIAMGRASHTFSYWHPCLIWENIAFEI